MTSIITEYPLWFIIFCLALGFAYAWLLYRKENKLEEASKLIIRSMFAFRFLTVSIISFLLLSPVIKSLGKTIENPIVVFAQDNSESVAYEKDKIQKFHSEIKSFFEENNNSYEFKSYTFGDNVKQSDSFSYTEKQTNISQLISDIKNKYYHRNIGALIISSDGIVNSGKNPEYIIQDVNFPVYSLALGDTAVKPDISISDIKYNKIAFLNNKFPVRINIRANKLKGKQAVIKLTDNGKIISTKTLNIKNSDFFKKIDFEIFAGTKGFHKIKIQIEASEEEENIQNNIKQVVVEVVDSKQKILILANSPHPDIAAIRQALELNQNFETEFYIASKFNKSVNAYNMVILHQIPSVNSRTSLMKQIINSDIPVLYILGSQSSLQKFDNLNTGLKTGAYSNSADEVTGILNKNFSLFDLNPEIQEITLNSPPILSAFGDYKISGNSEILFYRKIKNINTEQALIVFNSVPGGKKSVVITGEGIWRWRMYDYKTNQNHYLFNELINKIVQHLTQKETKERFKIISEKIIPENQDAVFKAEFYSKEYELINEPEVSLTITDSAKNSKNFIFEKSGKSYKLNAKKLQAGDYTWKAETIYKGKKYKKEGILSVVPVNIEAEKTTANHNLLYKLSKETGGKFFYANETEKLIKDIQNNENIVPVAFSEKKTEALINYKLIFFLILILLSAEWFMRKFFGAY
ncbi:MAG: hypothetical protein K8R54_13790 [Bacteroidales bacterium]|nr:hypothetical protein [Bacteroidales bacterium]